jgi:hypothetical protein
MKIESYLRHWLGEVAMTDKKGLFLRRVKRTWNSVVSGVKKLAGKARERVEIDSRFSQLALKWDRISKGMVKLDPTFMGIFDREALTVTCRVEDSLDKGQLIETEHVQYRVAEMRGEPIQLPLIIDQVTHLVPCRVAVLVRI